jgi:O-succinylbenzoate synthase
VLLRAIGDDGAEGWGECTAMERPAYSGEWVDGAWVMLRDFLVPVAFAGTPAGIRGHPMAAAALEVALLDLQLRRQGLGLSKHLDGVRDRVPCGVSLGIEERIDDLLDLVKHYVSAGYRRIKLKIEPGRDVEAVRAVRQAFPDTPLSVDANAAYDRETTAAALTAIDDLGLEYIEQPLAEDDLAGHADLQRRLATPICLDETITSHVAARGAIELGACRVINVKVGRVGGLAESLRIHDLAREMNVPLWVGGMLETGVGRAVNVALASLPGFTLPGDTSGSDRYFERDLTEPFVVDPDGTMAVPTGPGLGVTPLPDVLEAATVDRLMLRP